MGNVDRDHAQIAREDPTCLYLIMNGSLPEPMSAGKIAAQAFQAALWLLTDPRVDAERRAQLAAWQDEGARTITRIATTPTMWERVKAEIPGALLADEGLTEVPHGAETIFCAWPVRRSQAPKLLANKKIPLL